MAPPAYFARIGLRTDANIIIKLYIALRKLLKGHTTHLAKLCSSFSSDSFSIDSKDSKLGEMRVGAVPGMIIEALAG